MQGVRRQTARAYEKRWPNSVWEEWCFLALLVAAAVFSHSYVEDTASMTAEFPSYVEYQGYYNVPHERPPGRTRRAAASTPAAPQIPKLTAAEIRLVRSKVEQALVDYVHRQGRPLQEARRLLRDAVCGHNEDRTARVELPDFGLLTPELTVTLQKEVLSTHPLWRVFFVAISPDTVVIVYPKVVRIGGLPESPKWRQELGQVVKSVKAIEDEREGPERRQLAYLKARVRQEFTRWTGDGYHIVAAFDNYRGDTKRMTVLLVSPETTPYTWHHVKCVVDDVVSGGYNYVVDISGNANRLADTDLYDTVQVKWHISEFIIPKAHIDTCLLYRSVVGCKTTKIGLLKDFLPEVTTDAVLRSWEAGQRRKVGDQSGK